MDSSTHRKPVSKIILFLPEFPGVGCRYGADRTGIPDYAMGPAGARVIPSLTSDTHEVVSVGPVVVVDAVGVVALHGCVASLAKYWSFWCAS